MCIRDRQDGLRPCLADHPGPSRKGKETWAGNDLPGEPREIRRAIDAAIGIRQQAAKPLESAAQQPVTDTQAVVTVPAAWLAGSMVARIDSCSLPLALGNMDISCGDQNGGKRSEASVSYTHLDVYKRQL